MIYIDTGAFIARYLRRDQYYQPALEVWKELGRQPWRCYTSSFVLAETFTLGRRSSYQFAAKRARSILKCKPDLIIVSASTLVRIAINLGKLALL